MSGSGLFKFRAEFPGGRHHVGTSIFSSFDLDHLLPAGKDEAAAGE
jgi:hypothetical protein